MQARNLATFYSSELHWLDLLGELGRAMCGWVFFYDSGKVYFPQLLAGLCSTNHPAEEQKKILTKCKKKKSRFDPVGLPLA